MSESDSRRSCPVPNGVTVDLRLVRWGQAHTPVGHEAATYFLGAGHSVQDPSRRNLSRGRKLGRVPRRLSHRFVEHMRPSRGRLAAGIGGRSSGPSSGPRRREGEGAVRHPSPMAFWTRRAGWRPSLPPRARLYSSSRPGRDERKPRSRPARDRGSPVGVRPRRSPATCLRQTRVVGPQRRRRQRRLLFTRISTSSEERPAR